MTAGFPSVEPLVERCSRLDSPDSMIAARLTLLVVAAALMYAFRYVGIVYIASCHFVGTSSRAFRYVGARSGLRWHPFFYWLWPLCLLM